MKSAGPLFKSLKKLIDNKNNIVIIKKGCALIEAFKSF